MKPKTIYMTEETLTRMLQVLQESDIEYNPLRVTRVRGESVITICGMHVDTTLPDHPVVEKLGRSMFMQGERVEL